MRKRTLITAMALALGLSFTVPAVWADHHEGSSDQGGQEMSDEKDKKDENTGDENTGGCGGSAAETSEQSSD